MYEEWGINVCCEATCCSCNSSVTDFSIVHDRELAPAVLPPHISSPKYCPLFLVFKVNILESICPSKFRMHCWSPTFKPRAHFGVSWIKLIDRPTNQQTKQAKPSQIETNQTQPNHNQTKPNQIQPNQNQPNQTKPNHTNLPRSRTILEVRHSPHFMQCHSCLF